MNQHQRDLARRQQRVERAPIPRHVDVRVKVTPPPPKKPEKPKLEREKRKPARPAVEEWHGHALASAVFSSSGGLDPEEIHTAPLGDPDHVPSRIFCWIAGDGSSNNLHSSIAWTLLHTTESIGECKIYTATVDEGQSLPSGIGVSGNGTAVRISVGTVAAELKNGVIARPEIDEEKYISGTSPLSLELDKPPISKNFMAFGTQINGVTFGAIQEYPDLVNSYIELPPSQRFIDAYDTIGTFTEDPFLVTFTDAGYTLALSLLRLKGNTR